MPDNGQKKKRGVSYPPNLADAKKETPNGRKRDEERKHGTKVPRTERRKKNYMNKLFSDCFLCSIG